MILVGVRQQLWLGKAVWLHLLECGNSLGCTTRSSGRCLKRNNDTHDHGCQRSVSHHTLWLLVGVLDLNVLRRRCSRELASRTVLFSFQPPWYIHLHFLPENFFKYKMVYGMNSEIKHLLAIWWIVFRRNNTFAVLIITYAVPLGYRGLRSWGSPLWSIQGC